MASGKIAKLRIFFATDAHKKLATCPTWNPCSTCSEKPSRHLLPLSRGTWPPTPTTRRYPATRRLPRVYPPLPWTVCLLASRNWSMTSATPTAGVLSDEWASIYKAHNDKTLMRRLFYDLANFRFAQGQKSVSLMRHVARLAGAKAMKCRWPKATLPLWRIGKPPPPWQ